MSRTWYRLGRATHAVYAEEGAKGFVLLPEGAEVMLESMDASGRLVKVGWGRQHLLMFWQDLVERGVEVEDATREADTEGSIEPVKAAHSAAGRRP